MTPTNNTEAMDLKIRTKNLLKEERD